VEEGWRPMATEQPTGVLCCPKCGRPSIGATAEERIFRCENCGRGDWNKASHGHGPLSGQPVGGWGQ